VVLHSVGNYPGGTEIDVAINYADCYYLEALGRCAALAH
jgi:unsaturated chondroitin disaccharide hydrolase